jgi:Carboxypeptidase regulatory-like domain/TonB dependent receptor
MRFFRGVLMMAVAVLGNVTCLSAQTSQGRILGTVSDQSGAVVSGAKVTITNRGTNASRKLTTNGLGEYFAPALDPGDYNVTAEAPGFKKAERTSVVLEVSRDASINFKLQPGAVSETVEVTGERELLETTETTLNGVIANKAINELPLQGRDFQNLLPLNPGVQRTPGGGFHSVTSNGNRPDDNNFFIDGADDNDAYYGETVVNDAGIQGTPASILPLDAIQEFNTQESPSADFGVKPGVIVNMALKSGTNALHGSAYYFHRNSAFDARNYFNPAPQTLSALLLHQFGASVGGPIKKDKWFYFLNYEGIRDRVGNPGVTDSPVTVSLASQLGGIANSDGSPNSAIYSVPDAIAYYNDPNNVNYCLQNTNSTTCTVNPLSLQLKSLFLPNPGFTLKASDPAAIDFDFTNKNRGDNLVAKTDYILNSHNAFSARLIYSNTTQTEEDAFPLRPEWLSTTSPTTQVFGVSWTWTPNSTWINEARFSFNRFNESIFPVDHNLSPASYGLNTGITNPTLFGFPRISPGGEFNYLGGNSSWPLETTPSQTYNMSDTVSYTKGKHALRFGGEFRDGSVDYLRAGYGRGRVDFRHLPNFIDGDVRRWRLLYGDATRDVSMKSFGLFMQDDFRMLRNLTLNLGLRYDVTYPIKDSRNLLANYEPNSATGLVQVGHGISAPYPTNYNNVSPRVGFAWDIFGTGRTVLRAAAGLVYEQPSIRTFMFNGGGLNLNPSGLVGNGNLTTFLQVSSDPSLINWSKAGPIFPTASQAGNGCSLYNAAGDVNQCSVFAVDPHLKTPYVTNWNFNVQQALSSSAVLQVAYVANHGIRLYSITDINQVDPNSSLEINCGDCEGPGRPLNENCSVAQGGLGLGGPCFPGLGFFNYLSNRSNSSYNSLQVTLTKRYAHGLYLLAGYTYAHAIDTATSNLAGVPPDSLNYAAERGNGDYDIRHRFTVSLTYVLPSFKAKWQMLEGWQVNTVAMLEGGLPYTLGDSGDDISLTGELNDRWNMIGPAGNIHASPINSIPFISYNDFGTDATGNVTGNAQCINAAGGPASAGAQQLINFGCFVSGSTVITPPLYGAQGNMARNIFRGPSFRNWDFSVSKRWKFSDRISLQLRGEFFNILNHTNFDTTTMNTDLSSPTSVGTFAYTPDVGAANPVIGSGGSRHIQLGAKILW